MRLKLNATLQGTSQPLWAISSRLNSCFPCFATCMLPISFLSPLRSFGDVQTTSIVLDMLLMSVFFLGLFGSLEDHFASLRSYV